MKYLVYFVFDKLLYLLSLVNNKVDLSEAYRFSKHGKENEINYKETWERFLKSINYIVKENDTIYFVQMLLYSPEAIEKVKYLIKYKFWNYLEFYDEDYFPNTFMKFENQYDSSFYIFYLESNAENNHILLVKLDAGILTLIDNIKGTIPIYKIRQRQICYNKNSEIFVL